MIRFELLKFYQNYKSWFWPSKHITLCNWWSNFSMQQNLNHLYNFLGPKICKVYKNNNSNQTEVTKLNRYTLNQFKKISADKITTYINKMSLLRTNRCKLSALQWCFVPCIQKSEPILNIWLKEAFKDLASVAPQLVLSAVISRTPSCKYTDADYHS